jgi:hypothetical protein
LQTRHLFFGHTTVNTRLVDTHGADVSHQGLVQLQASLLVLEDLQHVLARKHNGSYRSFEQETAGRGLRRREHDLGLAFRKK